jgi:sulfopyruvate decarboxylase subunit alpha
MSTVSERLLQSLKKNGADFFVTVPCKLSAELITLIEHDPQVIHVEPTREEEGVGICAGAYMAGRTPVMVMQNSGIGNSVNAVCSLAQFYQVPLLMIMTHRGTAGERIGAQVPMGVVVRPLLESIRVPTFSFSHASDAERVGELVQYAHVARQPIAALLDFHFWMDG